MGETEETTATPETEASEDKAEEAKVESGC